MFMMYDGSDIHVDHNSDPTSFLASLEIELRVRYNSQRTLSGLVDIEYTH